MSVSYGYGGFAPASAHQNVKKLWDSLLHEQVLNKNAWAGLTGTDKGGEGALDSETPNKPIVLKTQLGKESGDQITMGLIASNVKQAWLNATGSNNWYNLGKTGNNQLVDNEGTLTMYNLKVKVAHQRFGISVDGKMTLQRTPYDLLKTAKDRISEQMIYTLDSSPFMALYAGYSQNVFRELGVSSAAPTAHPNSIYGKAKAAITNIDTTDTLDTDLLEYVRLFRVNTNMNPIKVDGDDYALFFIHPNGGKSLRADSAWIDANSFAMPRGKDNPIFQNMVGQWAGIVVRESNKIATAFDPTTITITSGAISDNTPSAPTLGGGITATNVHMNCLVGANAIGRAFALESYMAKRKEDDYENIHGFAGGFIYGDRRADFALSADSGTDGAVKNQSSAIIYTHDPTIGTLPTVWG